MSPGRCLTVGAVVAALLTGCGGASDAPPVASVTPTATVEVTPTPTATPVAEWPMYGRIPSRRRSMDVDFGPPFERAWSFKAGSLLEFPPVLRGEHLWVLDNVGHLVKLDARSGKVRFKRDVGSLVASSPAVTEDRVIATVLSRDDSTAGRVVAVRPDTGKKVWAHDLPARTESSPLIAGGMVYFGAENGTVYAMDQDDGEIRWTFQAPGAVKGALALSRNRLYFGDYSGQVHAVDRRDGRLLWSGSAGGNVYSTAAVGAGRVVVGSVGGGVYAFDARTGAPAWSVGTGSYVYSSPAIAPGPGGRPTAFIGSYDGNVYAIDVRSGAVRWTASAGGRVSGGLSVIGGIVYFSELDGRSTSGLDARTGKRVFSFPHGAFNPMIADREALYLTAHSAIYKLVPKQR